jgi:hypothetical protein
VTVSPHRITSLIFFNPGGKCLLRGKNWIFECSSVNRRCRGSGSYSPTSHSGGPRLIPGQSIWDLWWTEWQWERFSSEYFGFLLSMALHQSATLFIYTLLWPEGPTGEGWEPSKKQCSFGNWGEVDRKNILLCFVAVPCLLAVTHRPVIAEAQVRFQSSACEVCGGQTDSGIAFFFLRVLRVCFVSIILLVPHTHLRSNSIFMRRTSGRYLGTSNKAVLSRIWRKHSAGNNLRVNS